MPNATDWTSAEMFKKINGVDVFHTYKDDDIDQGINKYRYTLDKDSDDHSFDVRQLKVPSIGLLDAHPPYKTDSCREWLVATSAEKDAISAQWEKWHRDGDGGEMTAIATVIEEALTLNLLDIPEVSGETADHPEDEYVRPVSIQGGLATLEDGTTVDLLKIQAACNYAFQETGEMEFGTAADEMSKLTGKWQGPHGDWLNN